MLKIKFLKLLTGIFILLILFSCANRQKIDYFIRKEVDPSYIKRVAILRFENNSQESFAAERIRNVVITEILAMGLFDVVDKALVDMILEEEAIGEKMTLDKAALRRLAKKLGVQGLITGSVDTYEIVREGTYSYPVIAITLRLIDGATGEVIWQASGNVSGYSTIGRLFGLRPKDYTQLSFELVKRLLATLK